MAQDQQSISVGSAWTQLTNANVTAITIQPQGANIYVRFTTDETTPTESDGMLLRAGETILNKDIADLCNLSGADRVWAKSAGSDDVSVFVDHA